MNELPTDKRLAHLERSVMVQMAALTRYLNGQASVDFILWERDRKAPEK